MTTRSTEFQLHAPSREQAEPPLTGDSVQDWAQRLEKMDSEGRATFLIKVVQRNPEVVSKTTSIRATR